MGQINTNNYPAVDSLLDADLLIVENATHGTGTTTPKQLRENAIGTDPLQTTAQTVTGAINEVFGMANVPCGLELGKMTSFSDGVIVTDIDLHRAPVAGDRILFYHSASVASPSSLTTYNDGVAVTTTIGDFSLTHPAGLTLMKCIELGESLRWQTVQDIASGYTAGVGININGTTINNSAPQLGDDIAYSRIDTVTSGALGYFSADADLLVMDFRTDAAPYNGGYTLRLQTSGASFKYAVLKDKDGNSYADAIPAGSLVLCKSNVSGTGSEADPVVVTVLEIGNAEMAHDVEVLKDICITEKTVSGNPLTLTDALPYAALSLSADIKADQDLHGYDNPWVGGAGKNKAGGTITGAYVGSSGAIGADASFDLHYGKITSGVTYTITTDDPNFVGGFFASEPAIGSTTYDGQRIVINNKTFTAPITGYVAFRSNSGYTTAQLEIGSTATSFAPYSNICPISGHTSVTITRTDAESQTADFTISLGQTVYGGTVNLTTGVLTVKTAKVDISTLDIKQFPNTSVFYASVEDGSNDNVPPTSITSCYKLNTTSGVTSVADGEFQYGKPVVATGNRAFNCRDDRYNAIADFKAGIAGQDLEYPLANPFTIQLTPEQLTMLKGYNRLSSDGGGDITLTYKADRLAAIEAALAAL